MRFYLYTCKTQNKAIHYSTFIDNVLFQYRIEHLS